MHRNVLILEDRYALRDSMTNLGDRAYHVGLHDVLEGHLGLEVRMSPVKAFPYLTAAKTRHIRSAADAEAFLERWRARVQRAAGRTGPLGGRVRRTFENNVVTRSNWFRRIDRSVQRRMSRGLVETASPYLFRGGYAREIVDRISAADLVIFNGGAFVADHLDKYLPMPLFELYLAKSMGKPAAVVNHTVAIERPSNRALVAYVYSLLDCLMIREPRSRDRIIDLGIDPDRILQSCDAAFGLPLQTVAAPAARQPTGKVGVCVRGDRTVLADYWADVARHLQETLGLDVTFFFTSRQQDKRAFEEIRDRYAPIKHLPFCDYAPLLNTIEAFDFVITDRYHATIFAILVATPFVTIDSNTFKTRGLMDMVGYPVPVLKHGANLDETIRLIEDVREKRTSLAGTLDGARRKMSDYAKSSMEPLAAVGRDV
ncbi:MAG: polysaccharide pyruvyl transferase family protein [Proteobacteria bacterium]|nr:polysaccharide pyruvyl transferase family protein [Pseudomonadota bacterium]